MQCLAENRDSQSTGQMTYPAESPQDENQKPQLQPLLEHWTAKGPQTGHSTFSAFHGPVKAPEKPLPAEET